MASFSKINITAVVIGVLVDIVGTIGFGFISLVIYARGQDLEKLFGQAELDLIAGRATQIPVNGAVRIPGRFSRRLSFDGMELVVER